MAVKRKESQACYRQIYGQSKRLKRCSTCGELKPIIKFIGTTRNLMATSIHTRHAHDSHARDLIERARETIAYPAAMDDTGS